MQFDRNAFADEMRAALADPVPAEVKTCAGPYRWVLTPTRDENGLAVSYDLRPVARVTVPDEGPP